MNWDDPDGFVFRDNKHYLLWHEDEDNVSMWLYRKGSLYAFGIRIEPQSLQFLGYSSVCEITNPFGGRV